MFKSDHIFDTTSFYVIVDIGRRINYFYIAIRNTKIYI